MVEYAADDVETIASNWKRLKEQEARDRADADTKNKAEEEALKNVVENPNPPDLFSDDVPRYHGQALRMIEAFRRWRQEQGIEPWVNLNCSNTASPSCTWSRATRLF